VNISFFEQSLSKFVLAVGLSSLLGSVAFAQDAMQVQSPQPFTLTTPFDHKDEKKVLVYFKYDCPYCREYHSMLASWGQSLPPGYALEFVPVLETGVDGKILKKNLIPFSLYEALELVPGVTASNLLAFSERAYAIEQDGIKKPDGDMPEWNAAVRYSGISGVSVKDASHEVEKELPDLVERQGHYRLKETPTLVICGKYEVSPGITNGDHVMFQQLINGVMSKCLIDQGVRPPG